MMGLAGAGNGGRTRDIHLGKATRRFSDQTPSSAGERDRAIRTGSCSLLLFSSSGYRAPPKAPDLHRDQEQDKNRRPLSRLTPSGLPKPGKRGVDPFSPIIQANSVRVLVWVRRFDRAIEEGGKAVRDNPNFASAHFFLGLAHEATGTIREAIAEYHRAADLAGQTPGIWHRGRAEALEGRRAEALRTIEELKNLAARRYVASSYIATILIRLGDKDQAFVWLERALEQRSYDTLYLKVDPLFDGFRSDPRFPDLLRKAGFAPGTR
jgi:tetratricopeptide (TPR) repeat protein